MEAKNRIIAGCVLSLLLGACATGSKKKYSLYDEVTSAPVIEREKIRKEDTKAGAIAWDPEARICLVLGPGMARGFAHVGVLEAFVEKNVPLHCIVGMEMGAVVGGLFASSGEINALQWQLFKLKKNTYLDSALFSRAASGKKIHKFLRSYLGFKQQRDLKIKLIVPAMEPEYGRFITLDDEEVADAVSVAIAIPGIFEPWKINENKELFSGALFRPLPIALAKKKGATHVVVVDLLNDDFRLNFLDKDRKKIAMQFFVAKNISKYQRGEAQFLIKPELSNYSFMDFKRRAGIMAAGKEAAFITIEAMAEELALD